MTIVRQHLECHIENSISKENIFNKLPPMGFPVFSVIAMEPLGDPFPS